MPIDAAELQCWGCVNMADADAATQGGAIQDDAHATGGRKIQFTDISATGTIEILSDGADTRYLTIYGRLATGAIASEELQLNGATPVASSNSYERFLKALFTNGSAKSATRTVTIRKASDDVTIATLGINCFEVRRLFYDAASDPSVQKKRYELVYMKNTDPALSLTSAYVYLTTDPASKLKIAVRASKGDYGSTLADRVQGSTPEGLTFVDNPSGQAVPTGSLGSGERIGVWVEQDLAAGAAAFKDTFTLQLAGNTT